MTHLLLFLTTLLALLALEGVSLTPVASGDEYNPSNSDTGPPPDYTSDTGVRGPVCTTENAQLTLLIPQREKTPSMTETEQPPYGVTTHSQPTLLLYLPPTDATYGEFTLKTPTQWGRAETDSWFYLEFSPPPQGGIVQISLSEVTDYELEVGEWYEWSVVIPCNRYSENLVSRRGLIQRVQPSDTLLARINAISPSLQPQLYAEEGLWYEAASTLANLLQENPNDARLQRRWDELLDSAGLQELSDVPVLDCCTVEEIPQ